MMMTPFGLGIPQLVVDVAGSRHELGECRTTEDCMVGVFERHRFEGDWFGAEIILLTKRDA